MTIQTRDLCGFNNGTAKLSYSFNDAQSPPPITELRFVNTGERDTFNLNVLRRSDRQVLRAFSRAARQGADLVFDQAEIQTRFGVNLFMVDVIGHDGSHGWDFPFFVECWTS